MQTRLASTVAWAFMVLWIGVTAGLGTELSLAEEKQKEAEPEKGLHGGRLLVDGDVQIEMTIFETGVPPQFRIYPYLDKEPLDPKKVALTVELTRIGGRVDRFEFKSQDEYLTSAQVVEEPHSFDVKVVAEVGGKSHSWTYASYEGRTELSPDAAKQAGIETEKVGPVALKIKLPVSGRIGANEDRMVHVSPRYSGMVVEVRKRLGDSVGRGDILAVIESNASLSRQEVRSLLGGTVVMRDVNVGEFVTESDAIFVVADLTDVWVDLSIYREDFPKVKAGQALHLHPQQSQEELATTISYISPFGSADTQSMLARAVLPNPKRDLIPGLFVSGNILLAEETAAIAVKAAAIQKFRDWDVVFVQEGNVFQAVPLELGRRDDEWVEVVRGLVAGQAYVTVNSFVIKADIGKSGASHDH